MKLRMRINEYEFEASGDAAVVMTRYREWREMLHRLHGVRTPDLGQNDQPQPGA